MPRVWNKVRIWNLDTVQGAPILDSPKSFRRASFTFSYTKDPSVKETFKGYEIDRYVEKLSPIIS